MPAFMADCLGWGKRKNARRMEEDGAGRNPRPGRIAARTSRFNAASFPRQKIKEEGPMTNPANTPKPCPQCEAEPTVEIISWGVFIFCPEGRNKHLTVIGRDEKEALDSWNRRPTPRVEPEDACPVECEHEYESDCIESLRSAYRSEQSRRVEADDRTKQLEAQVIHPAHAIWEKYDSIKSRAEAAEAERIEWVKRGERAEKLNDELRAQVAALTAELVKLKAAWNPDATDGRHIGQACAKHDLTGCGCGSCLVAALSKIAALEAVVEPARNGLLAAVDVAERYNKELRGGAPATLKFIRDGLAALAALPQSASPSSGEKEGKP